METLLHVVCPHCDVINRVPSARAGEGAKCGQCKQALFTGYPVELNSANFAKHIEKSGIPVVVDFWAAWCGPCKMMAPFYERAARELEPNVRLAKLDTEAAPELAQRYGIRGIPTLILFKGGHEIALQSGAMDQRGIQHWVQAHHSGT